MNIQRHKCQFITTQLSYAIWPIIPLLLLNLDTNVKGVSTHKFILIEMCHKTTDHIGKKRDTAPERRRSPSGRFFVLRVWFLGKS